MILTKFEMGTLKHLDATHMINLGYILLCVAGIAFIDGIPLSEVSNDTLQYIRTSLPFKPSFGKLFLVSLFFNILLTTTFSSTWKRHKWLSRISLIIWLLSFSSSMFLYFRLDILFPEYNPFLFNWKLKCIAFASTTILSMVFSHFIRENLQQDVLQEENPNTPDLTSFELSFDEAEKEFLKKLESVITAKISEYNLNSKEVAREMCMSEPTLRRRIQKATGQTCAEFIRVQRFELAKTLLENGQILTKKELALRVGFKSVDYFSKLFENYMDQTKSMKV